MIDQIKAEAPPIKAADPDGLRGIRGGADAVARRAAMARQRRRISSLAQSILAKVSAGDLSRGEINTITQQLALAYRLPPLALLAEVGRGLNRSEPNGAAHRGLRRYPALLPARGLRETATSKAKVRTSASTPAKSPVTPIEQIALDASDVLGPRTKALKWLRDVRLPTLGNHTAEELISEGLQSAVLGVIDELRFGSRG